MTRPAGDPAWTDADLTNNPHAAADKARRVERMFAAIAHRYDLNNRLHSFGRDQAWRRAAVKMAQLEPTDTVLDVACGTGDLAIAFNEVLDHSREWQMLPEEKLHSVVGIDFTEAMLKIARHKASQGDPQRSYPAFARGDAMNMPVGDAFANVVSIAFGIRNVAVPAKAIAEFYRVLKPGGRLIILEFSTPTNPLIRFFDHIYRSHVMPVTATLIAHDTSGAYKYLPRSVDTFLDREGMTTMLRDAGFTDIVLKPMTFGVAVIYRGIKR